MPMNLKRANETRVILNQLQAGTATGSLAWTLCQRAPSLEALPLVQSVLTTPLATRQACAGAVDTHQYEMDCHAVRGLWTVGAVMLFVAFALLVYHTTHTEELQPGALMAVGSILFCSAIVFTAYTVVYISVLDGISTLVVTNGVSAHDYAVNLFSTLDTLLYVCALMFIYASMKLQRSGSSGTSTIYQKMNNAFFFADA